MPPPAPPVGAPASPQTPYPVYTWPDGAHAQVPGAPVPTPCAAPQGQTAVPGCAPYGAYPSYGYMSYGVPMMMVPVLVQKQCCPQQHVVEEVIEEPAPARRYIPPRRAIPDKRVRMAPDKRVPTKRIPY